MKEESDIEIRPVFEADDFGEAMTDKNRADWERLQAETGKLATR